MRHRVFSHLDAPLAPLYRAVLEVFVANKARFVVHLRPEDVADAVRSNGRPASHESIEAALDSLHDWGNLRADPDTGRVTTVADFYRSRYLYQLSPEGEAAERALEVFDRELGRRGELQTIALEDIRVRLHALREQAETAHPDPAVVHNLLLELAARLESLAGNASAFMGSLQRTIELQDVDEEAFLAYKDRLIAYLERFVSELVVKSFDITETLRGFDAGTLDALLELAARREAADAAPTEVDTGAAVPSGAGDGSTDAVAVRLEQWRRRWSGVRSWFIGDRVHPSQATLLRQRARKAIPDLLATVSLLQERRAGRSDRSADFRELARWFAQAPDDEHAHRLWRAGFGLSTARHLCGSVGSDGVPASTPWAQAPLVEIAPRLRATGHYQRRGKPTQVSDRSTERAYLAEMVRAERAQTDAVRARLATGQQVRLSGIGQLDRDEFALFLTLLSEALSAGPPGPDGRISTVTSDGSTQIVLTPVQDAPPATIHTPDGVLTGPEHELTITSRRSGSPGPQPVDPLVDLPVGAAG
jgi:uncharacterized protein (TIGR02677 family)